VQTGIRAPCVAMGLHTANEGTRFTMKEKTRTNGNSVHLDLVLSWLCLSVCLAMDQPQVWMRKEGGTKLRSIVRWIRVRRGKIFSNNEKLGTKSGCLE
jgi:hypothetical protein